VVDDTVADKDNSHKIELARQQYSGNLQGVIKGTSFVTCVYVNPKLDRFWIVDYRIYDPGSYPSNTPPLEFFLSNFLLLLVPQLA